LTSSPIKGRAQLQALYQEQAIRAVTELNLQSVAAGADEKSR
jgi:hypothetical protein